jgi:hypothetical protein
MLGLAVLSTACVNNVEQALHIIAKKRRNLTK